MPLSSLSQQTQDELLQTRRSLLQEVQRKLASLNEDEEELERMLKEVRESKERVKRQTHEEVAALESILRLAGVAFEERNGHAPPISDVQRTVDDYPTEGNMFDKCVWALKKIGYAEEPKAMDELIRPHEPDMRDYAVTEMCSRAFRSKPPRFFRQNMRDDVNLYGLPEWAHHTLDQPGYAVFEVNHLPPRYRSEVSDMFDQSEAEAHEQAEEAAHG